MIPYSKFKNILLILIVFVLPGKYVIAQQIYFPPANSDDWESINPESLDWCTEEMPALFQFLEEKKHQGFPSAQRRKNCSGKIFWQLSAGQLMVLGIRRKKPYILFNGPGITRKYAGPGRSHFILFGSGMDKLQCFQRKSHYYKRPAEHDHRPG